MTAEKPTPGFWLGHVALPVLALAALSVLLMARHGDFVVADALYALQGQQWWFRKTFLAENVIHVGGRDASILLWVVAGVVLWRMRGQERWAAWRRPLAYLLLATAAGVVATSLLKATTHMDCPWDLVRYGGARDFIGLFDPRPPSYPSGGCFPGGHASAGYAWVALYFFLREVRPARRGWGLAGGLAAGLLFGVSQQFRGAHFLSHDVWALALCWFLSLGLYLLMFGARGKPR